MYGFIQIFDNEVENNELDVHQHETSTSSSRYMDEMRTTAGQGAAVSGESIDSRTVVDMAAHYSVADNQEITFNVDNLPVYFISPSLGASTVGPRSCY